MVALQIMGEFGLWKVFTFFMFFFWAYVWFQWNLFHFTTGLEFAVETLKSFILSMALVDNHLTVETAVHLSRLELEFQVVHCFLKIDVDGISCMYATCGLSQGNIAQLLGWDKKRSVGTGARIRVKSGHEYWQWNMFLFDPSATLYSVNF